MTSPPPGLHLFNESLVSVPVDTEVASRIVGLISNHEHAYFDLLEIVYLGEEGIVAINQEYLERDYVTDIISFRYDEDPSNTHIEGTLFCCAPRILEQARTFKQTPEQEFKRVLIHGLLHLTGYDDQSTVDKQKMTKKENFYLGMLSKA